VQIVFYINIDFPISITKTKGAINQSLTLSIISLTPCTTASAAPVLATSLAISLIRVPINLLETPGGGFLQS